jgi:hypothetical protein
MLFPIRSPGVWLLANRRNGEAIGWILNGPADVVRRTR